MPSDYSPRWHPPAQVGEPSALLPRQSRVPATSGTLGAFAQAFQVQVDFSFSLRKDSTKEMTLFEVASTLAACV
jgi:hypothetical protein